MRALLLGAAMLSPWLIQAQQVPLATHNQMNAFAVNSAFAGIEGTMDARLGHRQQWVGFDGAPMTTWLTVHGSIGKKARKPFPYGLHLTDSTIYSKLFANAKPRVKHGWGVQLMYDRLGAFDRMQGSLAYSLHLPITKSVSLALSPNIGISNHGIRPDDIYLLDPNDPLYQQYIGSNGRFTHLDVGASALVYGKQWWLGYSARQILANRVYFGDQPTEAKLDIHHFINAGYIFKLSENTELQTNLMAGLAGANPIIGEASARVRFYQRFWAGASWRYQSTFSAMLGLNISSCFSLAYAYDYPYAMSRANTLGTHEIMLGFRPFNKTRKQNQYLW
jgi:type IX secretion system PorP/SprF family membrane protein